MPLHQGASPATGSTSPAGLSAAITHGGPRRSSCRCSAGSRAEADLPGDIVRAHLGRREILEGELLADAQWRWRLDEVELQEVGRWLNDRAEHSHQPFRRRGWAVERFRRMKTVQKFAPQRWKPDRRARRRGGRHRVALSIRCRRQSMLRSQRGGGGIGISRFKAETSVRRPAPTTIHSVANAT